MDNLCLPEYYQDLFNLNKEITIFFGIHKINENFLIKISFGTKQDSLNFLKISISSH